jgi:hypothetical protein
LLVRIAMFRLWYWSACGLWAQTCRKARRRRLFQAVSWGLVSAFGRWETHKQFWACLRILGLDHLLASGAFCAPDLSLILYDEGQLVGVHKLITFSQRLWFSGFLQEPLRCRNAASQCSCGLFLPILQLTLTLNGVSLACLSSMHETSKLAWKVGQCGLSWTSLIFQL